MNNTNPNNTQAPSIPETNIFAQIRREATDFFYGYIQPVPGYPFNQYITIKRSHLYTNSKYEDNTTYLGREKIFFNVVNPPCEVATKMLDVDTKNIRLWPINNDKQNQFKTYLLEKELKTWLKTSKMGKVLNQIAEEAPRYGSVVLEKTKDGAQVVDIRRLMLDPSVDYIKNSRFVTTIHYMTPTELRESGWDSDLVEYAITNFSTNQAQDAWEDRRGYLNTMNSTPYIKVFKRYGEVPESWIGQSDPEATVTKPNEKMVRALFIVAGADFLRTNIDGKPVGEKGVVLFSSAWRKEWPFKDFHYIKSKGRWLGVSIPEMLYDVQVRVNQLKNQKMIAMEVSSMHLFQTQDNTIVRNLLTDLESGDVIKAGVTGGITPIANEERNLAAFEQEEQSYIQQADKLTFAYDAVRGETPPSSTPLGTTQIVTAQSSSVFGFKRQNFCLMIRDFFNELVMPQLLKDLSAEHIMRFTGDLQELNKLDEAAVELHLNDFIVDRMLANELVTPEIVEQERQRALDEYRKLGGNRFVKIKDQFYKNAEYEFDYIIDNEQADPQLIAQNLRGVINDLASNPAVLQDPRLKLLYFKFASTIGINPAEMEMADQEAQKMQQDAQAQLPAQGAPNISGTLPSNLPPKL